MIRFGEKTRYYVADFETTNNKDDCFVWLACLTDFGMTKHEISHDMDDFMNNCFERCKGSVIFFHNLAFDGTYILDWLLRNGYEMTEKVRNNAFSCVISDYGEFYYIDVIVGYDKSKKQFYHIYFVDSLKLIPMSESRICKAFNLDVMKGEIDYNKPRSRGYKATDEEIAYIKNDCDIICKVLSQFREEGLLTGFTIGQIAVKEFKKGYDKWTLQRLFPEFDTETNAYFRKAYKGGWCYCNPVFKGETGVGEGLVYDVNSLYPSRMLLCPMPYGEPVYFTGEPNTKKQFICHIRCKFFLKTELKKFPFIQVKNMRFFKATEMLTTSNLEDIDLYLTSVDYKLFRENYFTWDMEYIDGYYFLCKAGIFTDYIERFSKMKIDGQLEGNMGKRQIAKLLLNNLYGKFATNPERRSKKPYMTADGMVKYETIDSDPGKPIYTPIACFITSYARDLTIRSAQANYDRFLYADTDSIHLLGKEIPDNIDIDDTRLGAWKLESQFDRGKYLHAKCYAEEYKGKLSVHIAGLPAKAASTLKFEDIKPGLSVDGKLARKKVKGGTILNETQFTIKDN